MPAPNREDLIKRLHDGLTVKDIYHRASVFFELDKDNGDFAKTTDPALQYLRDFAGEWIHVVKENTFIRKKPFESFTNDLAGVLKDNTKFQNDLSWIFNSYLENKKNFRSLSESVYRIDTESDIALVHAACTDEMFISVTGSKKSAMPDFDLSMIYRDNKNAFMDTYKKLISTVSKNDKYQIVLVKKKVGPFGPFRYRDDIRKIFSKHNIVCYSQRSDRIIEGSLLPDLPAIVLYDLCATGDGLQEIASTLRNQKQGIRNDKLISACVIHSFFEDAENRKTERGNDVPIWGIKEFASDMLERSKGVLDGIIAFSKAELPKDKLPVDMIDLQGDIPAEFRRTFKNNQPMLSYAEIMADLPQNA